jgi:phosphoribosylanthranilate isomerase
MNAGTDLARVASDYRLASGLLLDADDRQAKGGTGTGFDWTLVSGSCPLPLIVAGGLKPENALAALRQTRAYGLDVSSGVEAAKGVKDADKMAAFLKEVQDFDHTQ